MHVEIIRSNIFWQSFLLFRVTIIMRRILFSSSMSSVKLMITNRGEVTYFNKLLEKIWDLSTSDVASKKVYYTFYPQVVQNLVFLKLHSNCQIANFLDI